MESVVLVIHLLLALGIIAVVLIQPSDSGGLGGIGGGSGGFGGLTTARSAANILTRLTAIFVTGFIITSLTLAIMAGQKRSQGSILDAVPQTESQVEDSAEVQNDKDIIEEDVPQEIEEPTVPISQ